MKSLNTGFSGGEINFDHWYSGRLPAGLEFFCFKKTAFSHDLTLPVFEQEGLTLTFIDYRGELQIALGSESDYHLLNAAPGMGILSIASDRLTVRSSSQVFVSALRILIPFDWVSQFLKENINFQRISAVLYGEAKMLTAALNKKQTPVLTAVLAGGQNGLAPLPPTQNQLLTLIEYFLCNCHKNLLRNEQPPGMENEEDRLLIREVESYISEYYCSDTFTVDAILKKTYTSYHKLNYLFKSIHGVTISEYIRNKRIERSKEMIVDNVKSISQIAYEIGYSSISNYILAFKKIYQITPGKYKKQMDSVA